MDWNRSIDHYCERLDAGLVAQPWLAEPWNAASNLAFVVAGVWLVARYRRDAWTLRTLAAMIVAIGLGSGAFHLWARAWGELMDVAAIALFIHFFVACWFRHALGWRWRFAALAVPGFVVFSMALTAPFDARDFNGSVGYFPALAALLLMGVTIIWRRAPGAVWYFAAAAIFIVSIALRSVDMAWCARWPLGTHWLWHALNAVTLTLAVRGLERTRPAA